MDFAESVRAGIEVNKPVRISVVTSMETLQKFYSGELSLQPDDCVEYTENPASIQMAHQIYQYLFAPISLEALRKIVRHATYVGERQGRPIPTMEDVLLNGEEKIVWRDYVITFDYQVPLGDEDPNAVQLDVDEQLMVTGRPHRLAKEKARINHTLREDFYGYESA
jgi:hypothetical protein